MADSQNNKSSLAARLETYPNIEERLSRLLDLMEKRSGTLIKADDIEMALIPEVRGLGRELLEVWAQNKRRLASKRLKRRGILTTLKKTPLAYHLWGNHCCEILKDSFLKKI